jgi:hypothetical protein
MSEAASECFHGMLELVPPAWESEPFGAYLTPIPINIGYPPHDPFTD